MKTWPDLTLPESTPGTNHVQAAAAGELWLTSPRSMASRSSSSVEAAVVSTRSPGGEAALTLRPVAVAGLAVAAVVVASMLATVAGTIVVVLRDFPAIALTLLIGAYIRWGRQ